VKERQRYNSGDLAIESWQEHRRRVYLCRRGRLNMFCQHSQAVLQFAAPASADLQAWLQGLEGSN
jgi:hypothetical protein